LESLLSNILWSSQTNICAISLQYSRFFHVVTDDIRKWKSISLGRPVMAFRTKQVL